VRAVLSELAALPYENLSKIVAYHRSGRAETAQDISSRWLDDPARDPARAGVGGTCFSLTHWLKTRLENLGYSTAYLMADKRIAPNIHCGLLFEHEGRSYLLDPGYLIFEPLLLPAAGHSLTTWVSPNEIRLQDVSNEGVWRLFTGPRAGSSDPSGMAPLKHRFDFRKQPVDAAEFERHWEASHHWEMMRYPVLNRVHNGVQYYLQKSSLLIRSPDGGEMKKLTQAEVREAACGLFGLPPELVDEALRLLS